LNRGFSSDPFWDTASVVTINPNPSRLIAFSRLLRITFDQTFSRSSVLKVSVHFQRFLSGGRPFSSTNYDRVAAIVDAIHPIPAVLFIFIRYPAFTDIDILFPMAIGRCQKRHQHQTVKQNDLSIKENVEKICLIEM
jgi:hypothetical protein